MAIFVRVSGSTLAETRRSIHMMTANETTKTISVPTEPLKAP